MARIMALHDASPDLDDDSADEPPRVRPWRMILGSMIGLVGMGLVLCSWFVLRNPGPEPQGSGGVFGQWFVSIIAWVMLFVGGVVAVVALVTLVLALIEARAARAS